MQELPVEVGFRKQARLSSYPIEVVQLMLLQRVNDLIHVVLDPLEISLDLHPLSHVDQLPPLLLFVVGCVHHEYILVLLLLLLVRVKLVRGELGFLDPERNHKWGVNLWGGRVKLRKGLHKATE